LQAAIDGTREILGVPETYRIGIVPASDTGAVEMAMWSLLGARPVEMLAWESFGAGWVTDVLKQLRLAARVHAAPYGRLPDLAAVDWDADVVFTWNGTTSGGPAAEWRRDPGQPGRADDLRRDLRPRSPSGCPGTSSMRRLSPGKRCWAARPRMAC
jgi:phosphoserine aminotransferase